MKHVWKTYNGGQDINTFAGVNRGFCNGPLCVACGRAVCHHCYPEVYDEVCLGKIVTHVTPN